MLSYLKRKKFDWTGNTTLGSYFISSTASHYDWAIKKNKAISEVVSASLVWNRRKTNISLKAVILFRFWAVE